MSGVTINYCAESFDGVLVEYTNGETKRFTGFHFKLDYYDGDPYVEMIAISVPNVVENKFLKHFGVSMTESLQLIDIHELSHWADDTEDEENHDSDKWNYFLVSKIVNYQDVKTGVSG